MDGGGCVTQKSITETIVLRATDCRVHSVLTRIGNRPSSANIIKWGTGTTRRRRQHDPNERSNQLAATNQISQPSPVQVLVLLI